MKIRNLFMLLMLLGLLSLLSETAQADICVPSGQPPRCVIGRDMRPGHARAATFVVAKGRRGDVGNIQVAINRLPPQGGSVYIREGTYTINTSIVVPSRVSLIGTGFATLIQLGNGVNLPAIVNANPVAGDSQIIISNLRLVGNKANNNAGSGIDFQNVNNSRIEGCYIFDFPNFGISMSNQCMANALVANHCHFNDQSGIYLTDSNVNSIWANHLADNVQNGLYLLNTLVNYVFGNLCGVNGLSGIYLKGSNRNTLTANHCCANTQNGIYLKQSNANSVTGNQCNINNNEGIYLDTSNDNSLSANQCNDNANDGIILTSSDYNVIGGSRCSGNGSNGIDISNFVCDQNLVDGNLTLFNTGLGLSNAGNLTRLSDNW